MFLLTDIKKTYKLNKKRVLWSDDFSSQEKFYTKIHKFTKIEENWREQRYTAYLSEIYLYLYILSFFLYNLYLFFSVKFLSSHITLHFAKILSSVLKAEFLCELQTKK